MTDITGFQLARRRAADQAKKQQSVEAPAEEKPVAVEAPAEEKPRRKKGR
jgi:hypothetical protein